MLSYKNQAIQDVICAEFGQMTKEEVEAMTFSDNNEHYDYDKITCEGSMWIVYWYDVMNDYYHKNKDRIDAEVQLLLCGAAIITDKAERV